MGWIVRGTYAGGGEKFQHQPSPALRHTQPPVQWVPGEIPGLKWPGRDEDQQI